MTRRGMLRSGGMTVTLGALIAACGGEETQPGRVGNAPVVTPMPTVTVDDAVLLRTATSLEYTAIDVYAQAAELGVLGDEALALIERFVEDHQRHADIVAELTVEAGGEPYECTNSWLDERAVAPLLLQILGDEAQGIEPSDDPVRDLLSVSYAFESIAGATYQQFVETLSMPSLRQQVMMIGAEEVRHAAAIAIAGSGAPQGYISPVVYDMEIDAEANGGVPSLYAVPGSFGSLAPVEVVVGAETAAGTRFTAAAETPADNAFIYADMTCET